MADDRFPVGKAVGFALLSSALLEIEEQRGKGQGSRKRMTVRGRVILAKWGYQERSTSHGYFKENYDKPMVFFSDKPI
jgi:hypothetical protein